MTDHLGPDWSQEHADSPTAAVTLDAETRSPTEAPAPMLEVHAPHESIRTWKDFFIHIATIVIGLCIAVGLERSVEYL